MDIKTSRLDTSNPLAQPQQLTSNIHKGLAQLPAHARAALIADALSPATVKPAPALHAISHCEPATMEQLTQSIKTKRRRQLVRPDTRPQLRPQLQSLRAARALPWQWQLRTLATRMARQVKKAWTRATRMPARR
jgi:hypothetical protein